jgi:ABC-2 type transport system permease protein
MKYALLIAVREYLENAKTKGFWIGLFLFPLIIFGSMQVPVWLEKKGTPTRHFVLVDPSGQFERVALDALEKNHQRRVIQELQTYARKHSQTSSATSRPPAQAASGAAARKSIEPLLKELSATTPDAIERFQRQGGQKFYLEQFRPFLDPAAPAFEEPRRRFQRADLPAGLKPDMEWAALTQELRAHLRGGKKVAANGHASQLFAAILIPADVEKWIVRPGAAATLVPDPTKGIEYWSGNLADTELREQIERAINEEIRRREYVLRGMDLATIQQVQRTHVPFADLNPKKEEGQERVSRVDVMRQWAPTAFVYLLWIAIFSIVQMLLNNAIEEKSNRIIEVLLSSVTPGELMMGKLAGIAAIGLTMVGTWIASFVGILFWKSGAQSELASISTEMFTILRTTHLVPAFLVYFVFGYLLYGGLIITIGSICNTLKEAQNYMGTIVLILMVPLMTMMFIPKDPNGTLATALSWVPIYTPFVMMNRAAADPPLFEVIGTMILLIATTLLVLWLSGKIFRIGILRTGQPPKLIELFRWLKG